MDDRESIFGCALEHQGFMKYREICAAVLKQLESIS